MFCCVIAPPHSTFVIILCFQPDDRLLGLYPFSCPPSPFPPNSSSPFLSCTPCLGPPTDTSFLSFNNLRSFPSLFVLLWFFFPLFIHYLQQLLSRRKTSRTRVGDPLLHFPSRNLREKVAPMSPVPQACCAFSILSTPPKAPASLPLSSTDIFLLL